MNPPILNRARYDCGCQIIGTGTIDEPLHIRHCPTHRAAKDLLAACTWMLSAMDLVVDLAPGIDTGKASKELNKARAAITNAEGE